MSGPITIYGQDGALIFDSDAKPAIIGTEDEVRAFLMTVVSDPIYKGGTISVLDKAGALVFTASESAGVTFHPAAYAKE